MRFLILTQYFPPEVGAAQVRLLSIAREIRRRGHEVQVVTAMPNYPMGRVRDEYRGKLFARDQAGGIPVIRTWIYPASGSGVVRRTLSYLSFALSSLAGCAAAGRPDVLLVESPPLFLGMTGYLAGRLRRARVVMNVSDLWPASARELGMLNNRLLLRLAEALERFLYRHVDAVSAVTPGIAEAIRAQAPGTPVVFLPNGVDAELFRPVEPAPISGPGKRVFVYAGTHGFVSGLDVILGAAERLREREDVEFVFVGDGSDKKRLQRLAAERRLPNVRFLDARPVEDMPAVFAAAVASLVPLRKDEFFRKTLPAKMFPSLACATPVIHCGDGEAAALIEGSESGVVVPPERDDLLAAAVERMAGDPEGARTMGRNGRRLVEASYSWSSSVESWLRQLDIPDPDGARR